MCANPNIQIEFTIANIYTKVYVHTCAYWAQRSANAALFNVS